MAFEDIIGQRVVTGLEGLSGAVESGFKIAEARQMMQIRQEELDRAKQANKLALEDKAMALLPKINAATSATEKSFLLKRFEGLANSAGMDGVPGLMESLRNSPNTLKSYTESVDSLRKLYLDKPEKDYVGFSAAMNDLTRKMGLDPAFAQDTIDMAKAGYQEEIRLRAEMQKDREAEQKKLSELKISVAPTKAFSDGLAIMTPKEQFAALSALKAAQDKIAKLNSDFFRNEKQLALIPVADQNKARELLAVAQKDLLSPATVDQGRQRLQLLEQSIDASISAGSGEQAILNAEKERRKKNTENQKEYSSATKALADNSKDLIGRMESVGRLATYLNDPVISNSPIGTGAIATLLAKYLDPKTGVKEAEQKRVLADLFGSNVDTFKAWVKAITNGWVLTPEAKTILAKVVNLELKSIKTEVDAKKSYIERRYKDSELDSGLILEGAFGGKAALDLLEKGGISEKFLPDSFARPEGSTWSSWLDGVKSNLGIKSDASRFGAPPSAPPGRFAPAAPKAEAPAAAQAPQQAAAPKDKFDSMSDAELFKLWKQNQSQKQ